MITSFPLGDDLVYLIALKFRAEFFVLVTETDCFFVVLHMMVEMVI
jgi:hypothetical protein